MAHVTIREGESVESLIKRFKKQVIADGIMEDYRKHEFYVAPSLKRKEKHENALKRQRIAEKKSKGFRV